MSDRADAGALVSLETRWSIEPGRIDDVDGLGAMRVELKKRFQFEAAHLLPNLPEDHKCRRLHGHSFSVEVVVAGECDPEQGWLMDYADVSKAFQPLWVQLDHRYLNEIPGLENPTSEMIARWIWDRLKRDLPLLMEVSIAETCNSACVYRGED